MIVPFRYEPLRVPDAGADWSIRAVEISEKRSLDTTLPSLEAQSQIQGDERLNRHIAGYISQKRKFFISRISCLRASSTWIVNRSAIV
jgi:alkyl sulfatase BDS1-like metallo-beta-lactamase superfamily hydrolase